jgi:hypothetical protein
MKMVFFILTFFLLLIQITLYNMNEVFYQFIVFLIGYSFLLYFLVKRYNFISPLTLFVFISFFYFTAGTFDLFFYKNIFKLEETTMGLMLIFSFSFILLLTFLYSLFDKKDINFSFFSKVNNTLISSNYASIIYKLSSNVLIIIIVLYILKFISMFGLSIGSVSRGELYSSKSFLLVLLKIMIPTTILLFVWIRKIYNNRNKTRDYITFLFVIIFILFDMLFKGDRRVSISIVLGILAINYYMKNLPIKYIILGLISIIGLFLLGAIRNRPIERWGESINNFLTREFSPGNSEFAPFSMIAKYLLNEENFISMPTYFNSILSVVPSFLYPDRPLASSNWFTKTYFTDYYNSGGGWAFNMIVETTLNFGYFAPIFLSFFYLSFFLLAKQKGYVGILLVSIVVYVLTFSIRFDLTSIYQTILYSGISIFLILTIGLFLKKENYV